MPMVALAFLAEPGDAGGFTEFRYYQGGQFEAKVVS